MLQPFPINFLLENARNDSKFTNNVINLFVSTIELSGIFLHNDHEFLSLKEILKLLFRCFTISLHLVTNILPLPLWAYNL